MPYIDNYRFCSWYLLQIYVIINLLMIIDRCYKESLPIIQIYLSKSVWELSLFVNIVVNSRELSDRSWESLKSLRPLSTCFVLTTGNRQLAPLGDNLYIAVGIATLNRSATYRRCPAGNINYKYICTFWHFVFLYLWLKCESFHT